MIKNIKPFVVSLDSESHGCIVTDWLAIHDKLRSKVKRLYFRNNQNSIESGHVPAIRTDIKTTGTIGTKTEGSDAMHKELDAAFNKSSNPREFVRRVHLIASEHIQSGKKHINRSSISFFTVEGRSTNNEASMSDLRHDEILPAYHKRKNRMKLFSRLRISGDDGNDIDSPSSTTTEYTSSSEDSEEMKVPCR